MKNLKSFICNTVTLISSILFLVFMSQPVMIVVKRVFTGYKFIEFASNDAKITLMALGLLIGLIAACILILTSIYGILRSFNVIKSDKADKIFKILNISIATVTVAFMFLALIMNIAYVAQTNSDANKIEGITVTIAEIGYAIGVLFVLPIISLVSSVFDRKSKAKKSK